jgi:hypothetical protein
LSFTNGSPTLTTKPASPVLSSPSSEAIVSGSSVDFKWNATPGATKYFLHVNTSPKWNVATRKFYGIVGNITTFTNTGFPDDGTVYYWKVWAGNDAGWSLPSDTWTFTNGS